MDTGPNRRANLGRRPVEAARQEAAEPRSAADEDRGKHAGQHEHSRCSRQRRDERPGHGTGVERERQPGGQHKAADGRRPVDDDCGSHPRPRPAPANEEDTRDVPSELARQEVVRERADQVGPNGLEWPRGDVGGVEEELPAERRDEE
jgi:hypothetical protein